MELNTRTFVFIILALVILIYKNLPVVWAFTSCAAVHQEPNTRLNQQEILREKLCDSWVSLEGDFNHKIMLLERKHLSNHPNKPGYAFNEDQTIYTEGSRFNQTKQVECLPVWDQLGYWYLEGAFLFVAFKDESENSEEQVKIFEISACGNSRLILKEIRKYASYAEFREKLDHQLHEISQNRKHIVAADQLNKKEKIIRLIKLQDEFFHYPN